MQLFVWFSAPLCSFVDLRRDSSEEFGSFWGGLLLGVDPHAHTHKNTNPCTRFLRERGGGGGVPCSLPAYLIFLLFSLGIVDGIREKGQSSSYSTSGGKNFGLNFDWRRSNRGRRRGARKRTRSEGEAQAWRGWQRLHHRHHFLELERRIFETRCSSSSSGRCPQRLHPPPPPPPLRRRHPRRRRRGTNQEHQASINSYMFLSMYRHRLEEILISLSSRKSFSSMFGNPIYLTLLSPSYP